tara:strand:- start:464 stop:844 length:381 start_codon:yes stop_codon:yes gene_type:complete
MNLSIKDNYLKLNDLCDQIFDYFNLTIYDLENKLDNQLSIEKFKNKLDTFADMHFKSALLDFNNEIQNLKDHFPKELFQLENISEEIKRNFNDLLDNKIFDMDIISNLKERLKDSLNKVKIVKIDN